jgi:hypothetical protein
LFVGTIDTGKVLFDQDPQAGLIIDCLLTFDLDLIGISSPSLAEPER